MKFVFLYINYFYSKIFSKSSLLHEISGMTKFIKIWLKKWNLYFCIKIIFDNKFVQNQDYSWDKWYDKIYQNMT